MTALPQREEMVAEIEQARQAGALLKTASMELGLSARTFERWQREGVIRADSRPDSARPGPAHKLSEPEGEQVPGIAMSLVLPTFPEHKSCRAFGFVG